MLNFLRRLLWRDTEPVTASEVAAAARKRSAAGLPPDPAPGSRYTPEYVRAVARFAYLWAWPLVNIYNRYWTQDWVKTQTFLVGGVAPVTPINRLAMLCKSIDPGQRYITCPSQDLIYGFGVLDLGREPVVVQVPDFGSRFYVFQASDQRTDAYADIGSMYGTKPGFYLLVGPDWRGDLPEGITASFRAATNLGTIIPRIFQAEDPDDNASLQPLLQEVMAYPLSEFDGTMQRKDWSQLPTLPWVKLKDEEWRWVNPAKFFGVLPDALKACPPLRGEEAIYALVHSILEAANADASLREVLDEAAQEADTTLVTPLLQFRNFGVALPHNWTTVVNSAQFGTDYYTRTAVAKSNIFINRPHEARYFYQDLDADGARLNGTRSYRITFKKDEVPPVKGFWSITLYDKYHFLFENEIGRHAVGTRSRGLRYAEDGSLTLYVQRERPEEEHLANWLPAPADDFSLYIRAYWPLPPIDEGGWTPPPVLRQG